MWFEPKLLYTEALDKVKQGTQPRIDKEVWEVIHGIFQLVPDQEIIYFSTTDISNEIKIASGKVYARTEIKEVLQKWGLKGQKKMRYTRYSSLQTILTGEETVVNEKHTGTPYIFQRQNFSTKDE